MLGPAPAPFLGAWTSESHHRKIAIRPSWYSGVASSCGRNPWRKWSAFATRLVEKQEASFECPSSHRSGVTHVKVLWVTNGFGKGTSSAVYDVIPRLPPGQARDVGAPPDVTPFRSSKYVAGLCRWT